MKEIPVDKQVFFVLSRQGHSTWHSQNCFGLLGSPAGYTIAKGMSLHLFSNSSRCSWINFHNNVFHFCIVQQPCQLESNHCCSSLFCPQKGGGGRENGCPIILCFQFEQGGVAFEKDSTQCFLPEGKKFFWHLDQPDSSLLPTWALLCLIT